MVSWGFCPTVPAASPRASTCSSRCSEVVQPLRAPTSKRAVPDLHGLFLSSACVTRQPLGRQISSSPGCCGGCRSGQLVDVLVVVCAQPTLGLLVEGGPTARLPRGGGVCRPQTAIPRLPVLGSSRPNVPRTQRHPPEKSRARTRRSIFHLNRSSPALPHVLPPLLPHPAPRAAGSKRMCTALSFPIHLTVARCVSQVQLCATACVSNAPRLTSRPSRLSRCDLPPSLCTRRGSPSRRRTHELLRMCRCRACGGAAGGVEAALRHWCVCGLANAPPMSSSVPPSVPPNIPAPLSSCPHARLLGPSRRASRLVALTHDSTALRSRLAADQTSRHPSRASCRSSLPASLEGACVPDRYISESSGRSSSAVHTMLVCKWGWCVGGGLDVWCHVL